MSTELEDCLTIDRKQSKIKNFLHFITFWSLIFIFSFFIAVVIIAFEVAFSNVVTSELKDSKIKDNLKLVEQGWGEAGYYKIVQYNNQKMICIENKQCILLKD